MLDRGDELKLTVIDEDSRDMRATSALTDNEDKVAYNDEMHALLKKPAQFNHS